jgi:Protein of unknown function (DUF3293)
MPTPSTPPPPPPAAQLQLLRSHVGQFVYEVYRGSAPGRDAELDISLRVGRRAGDCTRWLASHGATSAVLISAWHAGGRRQEPPRNLQAQAALQAGIEAQGLRWLPARCLSESLQWADDALCVFDAAAADIDTWLVTYGQAAALGVQPGATPQPIWHPDHRRP